MATAGSDTPLSDTPRDILSKKPAKLTSRVLGASEALSKFSSIKETTDDETILDIKVHNPLKRIAKLLEDIKRHQTTTISLRFTIPLIALPVVLFVVFQIGRAQSLCAQTFTTQRGMIQVVSLKVPAKSPSPLQLVLSFFPAIPKPTTDLVDQDRAILLTNSEVIHIVHSSDLDLMPFRGESVLLTGNYSACTRSMTLDHADNLKEVTF